MTEHGHEHSHATASEWLHRLASAAILVVTLVLAPVFTLGWTLALTRQNRMLRNIVASQERIARDAQRANTLLTEQNRLLLNRTPLFVRVAEKLGVSRAESEALLRGRAAGAGGPTDP